MSGLAGVRSIAPPLPPAALVAAVRLLICEPLSQRFEETAEPGRKDAGATRMRGNSFSGIEPAARILTQPDRTGPGMTTAAAVAQFPPALDPVSSAKAAGLRYTTDTRPGIAASPPRAELHLHGRRRARGARLDRSSRESSRWSFRRRGPTSGSAPIRAAICRPPAATPAAASSIAITRSGARSATKRNTTA